jgi:hypothetical protein
MQKANMQKYDYFKIILILLKVACMSRWAESRNQKAENNRQIKQKAEMQKAKMQKADMSNVT